MLQTIFMTGVMIWALHRWLDASRAAAAAEVVAVLSACMRQNLPVPQSLRVAAQSCRRNTAAVLDRIADRIEKGDNIPEAMLKSWRGWGQDVRMELTAANRVGALPQAMEQAQHRLAQRCRHATQPRSVRPIFLLVPLLGVMFFTAIVSWHVLPGMGEFCGGSAWEDALLRPLDWLIYAWAPLGVMAVAVAWYGWTRLCPNGWLARGWRRMWQWFQWRLPGLRWLAMCESQAAVIELLRWAVVAGKPLDEAIAACCELPVNAAYRRRLKDWHKRVVVEGQSPSSAASAAGVGQGIAWALSGEVVGADAPRLLRLMARMHQANYDHRLRLARCILTPAMVVLVAIPVALLLASIVLMVDRMLRANMGLYT
jgi:type II secretory pathway component PulF